MNNIGVSDILTNPVRPVTADPRGTTGWSLGNPRPARLSGAPPASAATRFPQILWIEVCISC